MIVDRASFKLPERQTFESCTDYLATPPSQSPPSYAPHAEEDQVGRQTHGDQPVLLEIDAYLRQRT